MILSINHLLPGSGWRFITRTVETAGLGGYEAAKPVYSGKAVMRNWIFASVLAAAAALMYVAIFLKIM